SIILHLADGYNAREVARLLGTSCLTVRRGGSTGLHGKTLRGVNVYTRRRVQGPRQPSVLSNGGRAGRCRGSPQGTWTPGDWGRPISNWSPCEVAAEAVKHGIVATISQRHVGRF